MTTLAYAHIDFTPEGVPYISGTATKVVEVVLDHLAHGRDADETQRHHPHLTLGQIYSALAYYYDHQDEMDRDIEERESRPEAIVASLGESPIRAKLRAKDLFAGYDPEQVQHVIRSTAGALKRTDREQLKRDLRAQRGQKSKGRPSDY